SHLPLPTLSYSLSIQTPTTDIYTLSLHDALPISLRVTHNNVRKANIIFEKDTYRALHLIGFDAIMPGTILRDFGEMARYAFNSTKEAEKNLESRSEEHTSELQSRENLVCRLLLEKKKNN